VAGGAQPKELVESLKGIDVSRNATRSFNFVPPTTELPGTPLRMTARCHLLAKKKNLRNLRNLWTISNAEIREIGVDVRTPFQNPEIESAPHQNLDVTRLERECGVADNARIVA
jgi:hypothetical protein